MIKNNTSSEFVKKIGIDALKSAFRTHQELGRSGTDLIQKNQYGEEAMRGDVEAENAVINELKKHQFPATIYSEEHGRITIGSKQLYSVMLDGIDGSAWYKKDWESGRYATLVGIYSGINPKYSDYLFGGIMEHATKRLFYGIKGQGSFVMNVETDELGIIKTSDEHLLDKQTKIHVDQYWEVNRKKFLSKLTGFNILEYHICSAFHYSSVANGESDLALECTRKGNLEIAAVYGLIKESGGTMVTLDGEELAGKRYLQFGQDTHIPIITAASTELAKEAVKFFGK